MAFYYVFMLFFIVGLIALLGIVILGIIMFFFNILNKKPQNIIKILKMSEGLILVALVLFCFMILILFKEFVENNIVLFYFAIGIPTIFISKSLSRSLKNYKKDWFTWIFAISFGFASFSLCALLHNLLFNRIMKGESGFGAFFESLIVSAIVGIISVIINLIEINTGDFKEKFVGAKNDN